MTSETIGDSMPGHSNVFNPKSWASLVEDAKKDWTDEDHRAYEEYCAKWAEVKADE